MRGWRRMWYGWGDIVGGGHNSKFKNDEGQRKMVSFQET